MTPTKRHRVLLSLGSNVGDRDRMFRDARQQIAESVGPVVQASSEYQTEPWGTFAGDNRPEPFLNQVLAVETDREPLDLLDTLQQIEHRLGRPSHQPEYAPDGQRLYRSRTIDIDILFYDTLVLDIPRLTVPHPRIAERRFLLEPAVQIWPRYRHPVLKISLEELLNSFL